MTFFDTLFGKLDIFIIVEYFFELHRNSLAFNTEFTLFTGSTPIFLRELFNCGQEFFPSKNSKKLHRTEKLSRFYLMCKLVLINWRRGMIDGISASCKNASSATFYSRPWNKGWNLRRYFIRHKMFYLFFKKKTFCTGCFRLRDFTITCNADEYIMMGKDLSLGQLYDVYNWIEISKTIL